MDHVRLAERGQGQRGAASALEREGDGVRPAAASAPRKLRRPSTGRVMWNGDLSAELRGEVLRLAQPPVQARRRDLERIALAKVFERLTDRRAQFDVDPAWPVDEQRERRRLAAHLEIDELDLGEARG